MISCVLAVLGHSCFVCIASDLLSVCGHSFGLPSDRFGCVWIVCLRCVPCAEAKRTLASLRSEGKDKQADALQQRIIIAASALNLLEPKSSSTMKADMKVVCSKHKVPMSIWFEFLKLEAMDLLGMGKFDEFVTAIVPWKEHNASLLDADKPALAAIMAGMDVSDSALAANSLQDCFFCDNLSRMLKRDTTDDIESLCLKVLDKFDSAPAEALADVSEVLLEPMEAILVASRALLSLCHPTPHTDSYDAVKQLFAPESSSALCSSHSDLAASVGCSPCWKVLVDSYWAQASIDKEIAPNYFEVMQMLKNPDTEVPGIQKTVIVLKDWQGKLRPGGTRTLEKVMLSVIARNIDIMLKQGAATGAEHAPALSIDDLARASIFIEGLNLIDKKYIDAKDQGLARDLQGVMSNSARVAIAARVSILAESFTGKETELSTGADLLKQAANVPLGETVCMALVDMRGFIYKAIIALVEKVDDSSEAKERRAQLVGMVDSIHNIAGISVVALNEAGEYNAMSGLIKAGFAMVDAQSPLQVAADTFDGCEMMPFVQQAQSTMAAFGSLSIVQDSSKLETANAFHLNNLIKAFTKVGIDTACVRDRCTKACMDGLRQDFEIRIYFGKCCLGARLGSSEPRGFPTFRAGLTGSPVRILKLVLKSQSAPKQVFELFSRVFGRSF